MFNKVYYEDRKKKLEERFAINKDKILGKITAMLNEFWEDQKNLQQDFKEIEEAMKSELKEAEKNVKPRKN